MNINKFSKVVRKLLINCELFDVVKFDNLDHGIGIVVGFSQGNSLTLIAFEKTTDCNHRDTRKDYTANENLFVNNDIVNTFAKKAVWFSNQTVGIVGRLVPGTKYTGKLPVSYINAQDIREGDTICFSMPSNSYPISMDVFEIEEDEDEDNGAPIVSLIGRIYRQIPDGIIITNKHSFPFDAKVILIARTGEE